MTETDSNNQLVFVPLGGAGEIGMNLSLYGYGPSENHRWLMIDLGVTFARGAFPGTDVIMADPTFIQERSDRLEGLVITHAHEDHLGAVSYLWPRLRCPVYGTKFALSVLRRKLAHAGLVDDVPLVEISPGERLGIGPFLVELVNLTHSIPESNAVVIRTPAGLVLHTGDWKLDPDPVVGPVSDEDGLNAISREGVLAMVCDSTNALEPGSSGPEGSLLEPLSDIIGKSRGRVVVTCFASNIARLQTIATAANRHGRDVVISGASIKRNYSAARECGFLAEIPIFIDDADANILPSEKTVVICTGSQGEPNAALARIAYDNHPRLKLGSGDTVIFSSRVIPGNDVAIGQLHNALLRRGVEIITQREAFVHVSGHPARDELTRMYQTVRPRVSVPVHGEMRHMTEHAKLARACQVPEVVVAENGAVVQLAPGPAVINGTVTAGRLSLEGNRLVPLDGTLVRTRNKAIYNGAAVVTVVVNGSGGLASQPHLSTVGLLEDEDEIAHEHVCYFIRDAIDDLSKKSYNNDESVREAVRLAVRRAFRELFDKNPLTHIHLVRL
jgi:ribonuclease J